jgi:hypothetical protein
MGWILGEPAHDRPVRASYAGQFYECAGDRLFLVWRPADDDHARQRAFSRCAPALEVLEPVRPSYWRDGAVLLARRHIGVLERALADPGGPLPGARWDWAGEARCVLRRHALGLLRLEGGALVACGAGAAGLAA